MPDFLKKKTTWTNLITFFFTLITFVCIGSGPEWDSRGELLAGASPQNVFYQKQLQEF
jgi:hypothetical protein